MMGARWEYEAIKWYNELKLEHDPKRRVALARNIDEIRWKNCPVIMTDTGSEMTDPYIFWYTHQAVRLEAALVADRERLLMETPYGEPFIEEYDRMGLAFMERREEYALREYDEVDALHSMRCWQDSDAAYDYAIEMGLIKGTSYVGGPEGASIAQDQDWQEDARAVAAGPLIAGNIKRTPYGLRGSPQQFMELHDRPGQVVPPEGHGAVLDVGEAELPIPEGCSSPTRSGGQDGQSYPCDD